MKLNLDNFLRACDSKIDRIHYIIDDDSIVRTEYVSMYNLPCRYHTVKWWSVFIRYGKIELLVYLENPRKKYDVKEWYRRRKYYCEVNKILTGGDQND